MHAVRAAFNLGAAAAPRELSRLTVPRNEILALNGARLQAQRLPLRPGAALTAPL